MRFGALPVAQLTSMYVFLLKKLFSCIEFFSNTKQIETVINFSIFVQYLN